MRARKNDPGEPCVFLHRSHQKSQPLPCAIVFARDGFIPEHHPDRAAEIHKDISTLKPLDDTAHDLPFAPAPLVQNGIALRLA